MITPHSTPGEMVTPHSTPGEMVTLHSTPGEMVTPHTTPGDMVTPHTTPGEMVTPHTTPGEMVTPHSTPGEMVTPHTTPGAMVTPHTTPGEMVTPHSTPGEMVTPHTPPGEMVTPHSTPGEMVTPHTTTGEMVTPHPTPGEMVTPHTPGEMVTPHTPGEMVTTHGSPSSPHARKLSEGRAQRYAMGDSGGIPKEDTDVTSEVTHKDNEVTCRLTYKDIEVPSRVTHNDIEVTLQGEDAAVTSAPRVCDSQPSGDPALSLSAVHQHGLAGSLTELHPPPVRDVHQHGLAGSLTELHPPPVRDVHQHGLAGSLTEVHPPPVRDVHQGGLAGSLTELHPPPVRDVHQQGPAPWSDARAPHQPSTATAPAPWSDARASHQPNLPAAGADAHNAPACGRCSESSAITGPPTNGPQLVCKCSPPGSVLSDPLFVSTRAPNRQTVSESAAGETAVTAPLSDTGPFTGYNARGTSGCGKGVVCDDIPAPCDGMTRDPVCNRVSDPGAKQAVCDDIPAPCDVTTKEPECRHGVNDSVRHGCDDVAPGTTHDAASADRGMAESQSWSVTDDMGKLSVSFEELVPGAGRDVTSADDVMTGSRTCAVTANNAQGSALREGLGPGPRHDPLTVDDAVSDTRTVGSSLDSRDVVPVTATVSDTSPAVRRHLHATRSAARALRSRSGFRTHLSDYELPTCQHPSSPVHRMSVPSNLTYYTLLPHVAPVCEDSPGRRGLAAPGSEKRVWHVQSVQSPVAGQSLVSVSVSKKDLARPLYRKDIFYSGSVHTLPLFRSQPDMKSYITSITTIPGQAAFVAGGEAKVNSYPHLCSLYPHLPKVGVECPVPVPSVECPVPVSGVAFLYLCQVWRYLYLCQVWRYLYLCQVWSQLYLCQVWSVLYLCQVWSVLYLCQVWSVLYLCQVWRYLRVPQSVKDTLQEMLDLSLLKNPHFLLICLGNVLAFLGFYVPFVFGVDLAVSLGISKSRAAFLISVIGITNTVGRVVTGWLADLRRINSLVITYVSIFICGLSTALFPFCTTYGLLCAAASLFGLSVAAFISLTSILICDLLGLEKLTNGFGLLSLFRGLAAMTGPPLAGFVKEQSDSYKVSFYLAGALLVAGAMCHLALTSSRLRKWNDPRRDSRVMGELVVGKDSSSGVGPHGPVDGVV
ncbi:hypothetical protein ACOMHN_066607 [Nucella lapillus]